MKQRRRGLESLGFCRSLSDVQECAQLLCGEEMPKVLLNSLIAQTDLGHVVGVLNLTPYEGNLECHLIKRCASDSSKQFRTLSVTPDTTVGPFCQKVCAMLLFEDAMSWPKIDNQLRSLYRSVQDIFFLALRPALQDWKLGGCLMGSNVRRFDPEPPGLNPADYPLKLATLKVESGKTGWERFKIELPNQVRVLHLKDPVNGPSWRSLILDFDKKLLDCFFLLLICRSRSSLD